MIDATKKVSSTSAIEAKPDIVLVSQWIGEKKTGIEAFNLLKLDEAETSIFQTPAFHTWAQYATEMRKTRSPKVALGITLAILKKRFDEVDLAKCFLSRSTLQRTTLTETFSANYRGCCSKVGVQEEKISRPWQKVDVYDWY